jgi:hypothetical protein
MAFFTSTQISTLTGQSLVGVNIANLDLRLQLLDYQIQSLTMQNFGTVPVPNVQTKKVIHCGQKKWYFGGYIQKPKIFYKQRGNSNWIEMIEGSDYEYIYPDFVTTVDGLVVNSPVVGVDFRCLSCRCACEDLKVEGDKRWSSGLPDDLRFLYIQIISDFIANDPALQTATGNTTCSDFPIKSEKDHTTSVEYVVNEDLIKQSQSNSKNGFNSALFTPFFTKYSRYNFNLNMRF